MEVNKIIADFNLNCHDDVNSRGNPIHGVVVDNLLEGRLPPEMFIDDFISFRHLVNNLDGDDRAGIDITNRCNAGRVVALAGASLIISYIDDDVVDIPPHIRELIEIEPYGSWHEFFDAEFAVLTEEAYDNMCAFLFGVSIDRDRDNLAYDVHSVFDDLMYFTILEVSSIVHGVEDIFGSAVSMQTTYPVAYWDEYFMRASIIFDEEIEKNPQSLLEYLGSRGYIGQDNLRGHRRGSLRVIENNRSLWERGAVESRYAPLFRW